MHTITKIALVLAAIGAINWGLVGVFGWNLVDAIFGGGAFEQTSTLSRVVYVLVGLAGLGLLFAAPRLEERRSPPTRTQLPQT